MSLKDRIAEGTTTVKDADRYERLSNFSLGILRRGAILLIMFLSIGLLVGFALGALAIP